MKKLLTLALLVAALSTRAADQIITATITVTNAVTTNGMTLTVNGSTRTWTNDTTASPSTLISTNNSIGGSTTNLFNQIAAYPYANSLVLSYVASNSISLRAQLNGALTISSAGSWATTALSTQTVSTLEVIRVPFSSIPNATNRTNQASLLVTALQDYPTNSISATATALVNFVNLTTAQTITGAKTNTGANLYSNSAQLWIGGVVSNALGYFTGGYGSNMVFHSPTLTNGQNFGNAFRSPGSGSSSEQFGSGASVSGNNSVGFGPNVLVTNSGSVALGQLAQTYGNSATALGKQTVAGQNGVAIGTAAQALGTNSIAIGNGASAPYSNNVVLGAFGAATAQDQFILGNANHTIIAAGYLQSVLGFFGNILNLTNGTLYGTVGNGVRITNAISLNGSNAFIVNLNGTNGTLTGITATNSTINGTNTVRGDIAFTRFDVSTLANGNNLAVPFGTNVFIRLAAGSLTAGPTICGIVGGATTGGRDGQWINVLNDTGFSVTWANTSVDPTPANRINTQDGVDLTVVNKSVTVLIYDGNASRWRIAGLYPQTATATNAVAQLSGNATNLTVYTSASNNIPLTVVGATGQTNALLRIQDATGVPLWQIDTNGFEIGTNELRSKAFSTNQTATNIATIYINPDSVAWIRTVSVGYTTNGSNAAVIVQESGWRRPASAAAVQISSTQTPTSLKDGPASGWATAHTLSVSNVLITVAGGNLGTNVSWETWTSVRQQTMIPFGP